MQETWRAGMVTSTDASARRTVGLALIRVETIIYAAITLLALILRLAELDALPLAAAEATPALAAWKLLYPNSFVTVTTAPSPLVFAAQAVAFSTLGASEFTARLLTALAGVGVVLSPFMLRRLLGRTRTLLLVIALFFSPVLLVASRTSSPVVWSLLLAAVGAGAYWRHHDGGGNGYAVLATVAFASVALLADPAGILLLLTLGGAYALTRWTGQTDEDAERDAQPSRAWPWLNGLAVSALIIFVASTLFLLHPRGFNNVGALLDAGLRGLTMPYADAPPLYILLTSLFYEPFGWLFSFIGLYLSWRRGFPAVDRFFALWLLLGMIASLVFVGGGPDHALWLTVPLAGLTSRSLIEALREDPRNIWHFPGWARWLVALIVIGLMMILSVALQSVARSLTRLDPALGSDTLSRLDPIGMILVAMVVLFSIVGFFLVASVWDRATAARGTLLGLVLFGMTTALGAGWNAAVPNATFAAEPWHFQPTTENAALLRETLLEVAARQSRGQTSYSVALSGDTDGVLAWLLRDFTDVRVIASPADANNEVVVLAQSVIPGASEALIPAGYVGQDFILRETWTVANLRPFDVPAWWLQRYVSGAPLPFETVDLWVRQDVYAGVAAE